ncbi:MAG: hypothetical protein WAM73_03665 [Desulfobacterales bacterium]
MADMDDTRLKVEIDEIAAKIASTMKKIEDLVPLNGPATEAPAAAQTGSPPAGDDGPEGPSQAPK